MKLDSLIPWPLGKNGEMMKSGDPFLAFQKEMNALFENFSKNFFTGVPERMKDIAEFPATFPKMDVSETDKEIKVAAELPGIDEKDLDVTVSDGVLTIKGEKKAEKEEKKANYYRMERSFGSFQRAIPLPAEVDKDKVQANFKKGVLTITLPKTEKAQKDVKKVAVKSGE